MDSLNPPTGLIPSFKQKKRKEEALEKFKNTLRKELLFSYYLIWKIKLKKKKRLRA